MGVVRHGNEDPRLRSKDVTSLWAPKTLVLRTVRRPTINMQNEVFVEGKTDELLIILSLRPVIGNRTSRKRAVS